MDKREKQLKEFGKNLKKLILDNGYQSVDNFALSNETVNRATIYRIVKGEIEPKLTTLLKIAESLEIPPSELLEYLKPKKGKSK